MADNCKHLLTFNQEWAEKQQAENPDFFAGLAKGQSPKYLWIGCADSRVVPNQITGTQAGDIFMHRNVANLVVHTDLNMLSVLQYAVEVLKVEHIIVCGHYGCGGVAAALGNNDNGLVNKWIVHIKETYIKHRAEIEAITDPELQQKKMVDLNVMQQVRNLAKTAIVQKAWKDRELEVHGWVFDLASGKLNDLGVTMDEASDLDAIFRLNV